MTPLRLWDTRSRGLRDVRPRHPDGAVRVYHCGPTVYDSPHLGNLRRFLVADLLSRTLAYLGYDVRSVMNITDVGHLLDEDHTEAGTDRMVLAAKREGRSPEEIAARYTKEFFDALATLHAEPAHHYPRATMHIPQMIRLTENLLGKGFAYETPSGVYLDVSRFPAYGALSGNTLDAIKAGARVRAREDKRHPADFALWIKAPKEHRMQWDAPWGRGYPGWHVECSAMALHTLGETLDIHTGGEDNIFPHHENELIQSEGATGKPFARIWVHNAHLLVNGKKMSKSEGTFLTLRDIEARGVDPLAFRLLALQTHYRSKLNFTWEALDAAAEGLETLRAFVAGVWRNARRDGGRREASGSAKPWSAEDMREKVRNALADDLGSPQALSVVFDAARTLNPAVASDTLGQETANEVLDTLRDVDRVLALLDVDARRERVPLPERVRTLVEEREAARAAGDFDRADDLRVKIRDEGFTIEDTPGGPRVARAEEHPPERAE